MQAAGIDPDEQYGRLVDYQIDAEKITYYVKQGLVDVKKKLNVSRTPSSEFRTKDWTYPYVRASRAATPILREFGADPKATDSSQRSRLHYCINSLFTSCGPDDVEELFELGLDVKQADSIGNTPLRLVMNFYQIPEAPGSGRWRQATLADLEPLMQMLLAAGADVERRITTMSRRWFSLYKDGSGRWPASCSTRRAPRRSRRRRATTSYISPS